MGECQQLKWTRNTVRLIKAVLTCSCGQLALWHRGCQLTVPRPKPALPQHPQFLTNSWHYHSICRQRKLAAHINVSVITSGTLTHALESRDESKSIPELCTVRISSARIPAAEAGNFRWFTLAAKLRTLQLRLSGTGGKFVCQQKVTWSGSKHTA